MFNSSRRWPLLPPTRAALVLCVVFGVACSGTSQNNAMTGASAGGNWLLESVTTYAGGTPETSTFDSSNGKIY